MLFTIQKQGNFWTMHKDMDISQQKKLCVHVNK